MTKRLNTEPTDQQMMREFRILREHNGFEPDMAVEVPSESIRGNKMSWTWKYAWLDRNGNVESYTLFGGVTQHGQYRSFTPDKVVPVGTEVTRKRRTSKAS